MWNSKNLKMPLIMGLLMTSSLLLSGCGELNSQFTCPMKPGVNCQSLDQVNSLVDQGKLAQSSPTQSMQSASTVDIHYLAAAGDSNSAIQRNPEAVMRLWIAPYEDSRGNYFSDTHIYHVIQSGSWTTESLAKDKAHAK